jgi:hypothetical protein
MCSLRISAASSARGLRIGFVVMAGKSRLTSPYAGAVTKRPHDWEGMKEKPHGQGVFEKVSRLHAKMARMAIDSGERMERLITGALVAWTVACALAFVGMVGFGIYSGVRNAMHPPPSSENFQAQGD